MGKGHGGMVMVLCMCVSEVSRAFVWLEGSNGFFPSWPGLLPLAECFFLWNVGAERGDFLGGGLLPPFFKRREIVYRKLRKFPSLKIG